MTTPGDGALPSRGYREALSGSSLAARIAFLLAFMGGIAWAGFAVKAIGNIRPNRNHLDYYPSSGTVVYPPSSTWAWWTIGVGCLAATLLLSGAAMLAMRILASRILIILGCCVVTAYNIFSIVAARRAQSQPVHDAMRFLLSCRLSSWCLRLSPSYSCSRRQRDAGSNLHNKADEVQTPLTAERSCRPRQP